MIQDLIELLPEQHQTNFKIISDEIQPLVDDESYPQAIARLNMILRGIPVDQENRLLRAAFLAKRGEVNLEAELYEDAEEDLRHASQNGLRHPTIFALSGWVQYQKDEIDRALSFFNRALEGDATLINARMGRAMIYQDQGELELASADLSICISQEPDNDGVLGMRADVYTELGQLAEAEADLRAAHALDATDDDHRIGLARLRFAQGDTAEALAIVEDVANGENPDLLALLLRSHLNLVGDNIKAAKADAMSASNRFPDEAFAFVQLARVQLTAGNPALAKKAAERAVRLDSSLPDAYMVRGAARQLFGDSDTEEDFRKASAEAAELPAFLFGPFYEAIDPASFNNAILELIQPVVPEPAPAAGGFPGMGGLGALGGLGGLGGLGSLLGGGGGMDPMRMMGQLFDDQGNIRPALKPMLEMALRNAPALLKNMPPSMLQSMGGIDPSMLEGVDLSNVSSEDLEAQMKQFYNMSKSGQDPMDLINPGGKKGGTGGNDS